MPVAVSVAAGGTATTGATPQGSPVAPTLLHTHSGAFHGNGGNGSGGHLGVAALSMPDSAALPPRCNTSTGFHYASANAGHGHGHGTGRASASATPVPGVPTLAGVDVAQLLSLVGLRTVTVPTPTATPGAVSGAVPLPVPLPGSVSAGGAALSSVGARGATPSLTAMDVLRQHTPSAASHASFAGSHSQLTQYQPQPLLQGPGASPQQLAQAQAQAQQQQSRHTAALAAAEAAAAAAAALTPQSMVRASSVDTGLQMHMPPGVPATAAAAAAPALSSAATAVPASATATAADPAALASWRPLTDLSLPPLERCFALSVAWVASGPSHLDRVIGQVALVDCSGNVLLECNVLPSVSVVSALTPLTGIVASELTAAEGALPLDAVREAVRDVLAAFAPPLTVDPAALGEAEGGSMWSRAASNQPLWSRTSSAVLIGRQVDRAVAALGLRAPVPPPGSAGAAAAAAGALAAVAGPGGDFSAWLDTSAAWALPDARYGRTLYSLHHEARALLGADIAPAALVASGMLPGKGALAAYAPPEPAAAQGDARTHAAHMSAAMMALYTQRRDADAAGRAAVAAEPDGAAAASLAAAAGAGAAVFAATAAAGAAAAAQATGSLSASDAAAASVPATTGTAGTAGASGAAAGQHPLSAVSVPSWLWAFHDKLRTTSKTATPAALHPVIDGVCSGNRQTCICGAPYY